MSEIACETLRNWNDKISQKQLVLVAEARIYTDAGIIGEVHDLGPYSFINTIPSANDSFPRPIRPAILARVELFSPGRSEIHPWRDSNFAHYHGGDYMDELAALVSLFLGIRAKAGAVNRLFYSPEDRFGKPIEYEGKNEPLLPITSGLPQIIRLGSIRNLTDIEILRDLPRSEIGDVNALVKAARQYQQAIWVADSDPNLAWLILVSAIEIVAERWSSEAKSPRERLETWNKGIFDLLLENLCDKTINKIAKALSNITRSTSKFVEFICEFYSGEPENRPREFARFSFNTENIRSAAKIVYSHRSNSLHNGVAFPRPMCEAPKILRFSEDDVDAVPPEKPTYRAASSAGAVWKDTDTPMLLHTFEHITRTAIISWWTRRRME